MSILPHLICLGWPGTEAYNGAVAMAVAISNGVEMERGVGG